MPPDDIALVMEAYRLSKSAHKGQMRESGERYFEHPKEVALILIENGVTDRDIIITALIHDCSEDVFIFGSVQQAPTNIARQFGTRVAGFVDKLTKRPCEPTKRKIRDIAYHENIQNAELEVRLVKIADRTHNIKNLNACAQEKQERYRAETKKYFVPLAESVLATCPKIADALLLECERQGIIPIRDYFAIS